MIKFKIISLTALAIGGLVASLIVHHKSQVNFRDNETLMRQQNDQLATLTAENQRLSNLAAHTHVAPPDDSAAELARLRAEADTLKKQTNTLATQLQKISAPRPPQPAPASESHPPEYWKQIQEMAGDKSTDARNLATAFLYYASDHQNQVPSNFDQLAPYLAKPNLIFSGTNQFEIVYHGSLDKLQGVPNGTIALVRDQQTWQGPDGRLMRVYGMANGVGQIVSSDDNFQAWESKHVISPPNPAQPGQ
jgi:hypothetical protein